MIEFWIWCIHLCLFQHPIEWASSNAALFQLMLCTMPAFQQEFPFHMRLNRQGPKFARRQLPQCSEYQTPAYNQNIYVVIYQNHHYQRQSFTKSLTSSWWLDKCVPYHKSIWRDLWGDDVSGRTSDMQGQPLECTQGASSSPRDFPRACKRDARLYPEINIYKNKLICAFPFPVQS